MALRAYLDASEPFPDVSRAPCVAVAGFVADVEAWARCQEQWGTVLAEADISVFHMAEEKDSPVLGSLVELIITMAEDGLGFAAVIRKADYAALDEATKRSVGRPFALAAKVCLGVVARWLADHRIHEDVAYVCEFGDPGLPGFQKVITEIADASEAFKTQMRIHSVTVEAKGKSPMLQTADVLAWEITRHLPKRLGLDPAPIRPSLERILDAVPIEVEFFDAEALQRVSARHSPEMYQRVANQFGVRLKPQRQRGRRPRQNT